MDDYGNEYFTWEWAMFNMGFEVSYSVYGGEGCYNWAFDEDV